MFKSLPDLIVCAEITIKIWDFHHQKIVSPFAYIRGPICSANEITHKRCFDYAKKFNNYSRYEESKGSNRLWNKAHMQEKIT